MIGWDVMIVMTKDCCGGSPRIEGRRITVSDILGNLADGLSIVEIAEDFQLTTSEVVEAIEWAKDYIEFQFSQKDVIL